MKRLLKTLAGVGVSAFFVWLSLRHKDVSSIVAHVRGADYRYLLGYLVILSAIHLCRTLRWGLMLAPMEPELGFRRLNSVSAVGIMLLVLLPFRLGELARPLLMADGRNLRFGNVMPSILVERILDGLCMAALLLSTLPFVESDSGQLVYLRSGAWLCASIFGGAGLVMLLAALAHDLTLRVLRGVFGHISPHLTDSLVALVETFLVGLRTLPSYKSMLGYVALTLVYWTLNGLGMGLLAQGFGIHLSLLGMFTCLAVLVIGLMIPAGPGMVGTFQYFTEMGLRLFVSSQVIDGAGSAFSNVLWAAQFGQQVVFGLIFAAGGGVGFASIERFLERGDELPDNNLQGTP